jgi:putative DNA primase/helicase
MLPLAGEVESDPRRGDKSDWWAQKREAAAQKAAAIWNKSQSDMRTSDPTVLEHPYLKRKCIRAHGAKIFRGDMSIGGMNCNGALMIPMHLNSKITSLQFINGKGEKRFLPDGEKGGYRIGNITSGSTVCVCEGDLL